MAYTNQPTPVSSVLVCVSYTVMVEMTDKTVITLSTPWGCPNEQTINHYWTGWRNNTAAELTELARDHNRNKRSACNAALHMDKVRRLGHDYAQRGY
jgi:hypothetical protein